MANEDVKAQGYESALKAAYYLYLENGIENVTKEMIALKCGLSVRTLHRYFSNKIDCVINVAERVLMKIRMDTSVNYPESVFSSGEYTGLQLLEKYMNSIKEIYLRDSRVFALYSEFKMYIYRHGDDFEQSYIMLCNQMGNRRLRQHIYKLGIQDGSMSKNIDIVKEEGYLTESYFGFLSNLSFSGRLLSREDIEIQIDSRIKNTIDLYRGKGSLISNAEFGT